jgi:MerR family transcriptional regulator/heat shock protein HspR
VNAGSVEPNRGVFSISVAAELSGLHPQTLRGYEREGLLDPMRSPGGTRYYSPGDIDRLREISELTSAGVNLAGVRRVLELLQETGRLQSELDRVRQRGVSRRRTPRRRPRADGRT